jgi:hypothetical protein
MVAITGSTIRLVINTIQVPRRALNRRIKIRPIRLAANMSPVTGNRNLSEISISPFWRENIM